MSQHQSYAAKVLAGFFGLIVLVISSTTSFGFFYTFFDALVPPSVIDPGLGALISGMVGALLFDIACAIWLYIFLHHAETPEQRGISLIMAVVTFIGAAAASVAYLALTATGELTVDVTTKDSIATLALVIVIIGVVSNFGAMQAYQRYSFQNKQKVREADRRDSVQRAEDEGAKYLDDLLGQRVKEKLEGAAEGLAEAQASRILEQFYRQESAKYSRTDGEKGTGNGRGKVLPGAPLKKVQPVADYEDTEAAAPVTRPRAIAHDVFVWTGNDDPWGFLGRFESLEEAVKAADENVSRYQSWVMIRTEKNEVVMYKGIAPPQFEHLSNGKGNGVQKDSPLAQ